MQGQIISINGKTYNRTIEHLAGVGEDRVEKVTWFECYGITEKEIYDQEEMLRLENSYEKILTSIISPVLPII
jgi:hypothetical protein